MEEKTFSDPLEPLSEDANRAMLGCCEELAKDASDAMWMMDDIVRRAEENIRLYNDNNKYARLVRAAYESKFGKPKEKDIMEEKKTKKMTKAEAFEWLKCKKVYCYDGTNTLYCKLVKKLLACGCDYKGFMCPHNYSVSALAIDREGRVGHVPTEVFERYINLPFEAISADDILSIEIVEEKKPSQEFVPYELTEMGKVQSTLDDGEVLIITRKQILKIQL